MPMDAFKKGVPGLCEAIGKTEERYLCSVSPYLDALGFANMLT